MKKEEMLLFLLLARSSISSFTAAMAINNGGKKAAEDKGISITGKRLPYNDLARSSVSFLPAGLAAA